MAYASIEVSSHHNKAAVVLGAFHKTRYYIEERIVLFDVFQDVTGDGKLDMDDTRLIEREALKLFRQEGLEEGQLKLFVEDGAYG